MSDLLSTSSLHQNTLPTRPFGFPATDHSQQPVSMSSKDSFTKASTSSVPELPLDLNIDALLAEGAELAGMEAPETRDTFMARNAKPHKTEGLKDTTNRTLEKIKSASIHRIPEKGPKKVYRQILKEHLPATLLEGNEKKQIKRLAKNDPTPGLNKSQKQQKAKEQITLMNEAYPAEARAAIRSEFKQAFTNVAAGIAPNQKPEAILAQLNQVEHRVAHPKWWDKFADFARKIKLKA
jgi:hypothetical protein